MKPPLRPTLLSGLVPSSRPPAPNSAASPSPARLPPPPTTHTPLPTHPTHGTILSISAPPPTSPPLPPPVVTGRRISCPSRVPAPLSTSPHPIPHHPPLYYRPAPPRATPMHPLLRRPGHSPTVDASPTTPPTPTPPPHPPLLPPLRPPDAPHPPSSLLRDLLSAADARPSVRPQPHHVAANRATRPHSRTGDVLPGIPRRRHHPAATTRNPLTLLGTPHPTPPPHLSDPLPDKRTRSPPPASRPPRPTPRRRAGRSAQCRAHASPPHRSPPDPPDPETRLTSAPTASFPPRPL